MKKLVIIGIIVIFSAFCNFPVFANEQHSDWSIVYQFNSTSKAVCSYSYEDTVNSCTDYFTYEDGVLTLKADGWIYEVFGLGEITVKAASDISMEGMKFYETQPVFDGGSIKMDNMYSEDGVVTVNSGSLTIGSVGTTFSYMDVYGLLINGGTLSVSGSSSLSPYVVNIRGNLFKITGGFFSASNAYTAIRFENSELYSEDDFVVSFEGGISEFSEIRSEILSLEEPYVHNSAVIFTLGNPEEYNFFGKDMGIVESNACVYWEDINRFPEDTSLSATVGIVGDPVTIKSGYSYKKVHGYMINSYLKHVEDGGESYYKLNKCEYGEYDIIGENTNTTDTESDDDNHLPILIYGLIFCAVIIISIIVFIVLRKKKLRHSADSYNHSFDNCSDISTNANVASALDSQTPITSAYTTGTIVRPTHEINEDSGDQLK